MATTDSRPFPRRWCCGVLATSMCGGKWFCPRCFDRAHPRDANGNVVHLPRGEVLPDRQGDAEIPTSLSRT